MGYILTLIFHGFSISHFLILRITEAWIINAQNCNEQLARLKTEVICLFSLKQNIDFQLIGLSVHGTLTRSTFPRRILSLLHTFTLNPCFMRCNVPCLISNSCTFKIWTNSSKNSSNQTRNRL